MSISINNFKSFATPEITITFNGLEITIKKYISQITKQYIANNISTIYFTYDEELNRSGREISHILYICFLAKYYTNIELSDSEIDDCNILVESGLYNKIIENIPQFEIDSLNKCIDEAIDEERTNRLMAKLSAIETRLVDIKEDSLENTIKNFLNNINENMSEKKLLSFMKKGIKEFNKVNPEKFTMIQDILQGIGEKEMPSTENTIKAMNQMKEFVASKKK